MSNFRIGDKLIALPKADFWNSALPPYAVGTLVGIEPNGKYKVKFPELGATNGGVQFFSDKDSDEFEIVIREEIFNSPLFAALKEKNEV